MHSDISKSLLILLGWLVQFSDQLDCVQCTSPIQRVGEKWNHSCLDGTLTPLPCPAAINQSALMYKQCVSALYRIGQRGSAGVLIYRGCTRIHVVQHECDPPEPLIDFDSTSPFYCSLTCSNDGCNRHSVDDISSNSKDNSAKKLQHERFAFLCLLLLCLFKS